MQFNISAGVNIQNGGTLSFGGGNTLDSKYSRWSGVDIESGGRLVLNGDITMNEAATAIDIRDTNGIIMNGNGITINDTSDRGIYVYSCSPSFTNVLVDGVGTSITDAGVYVTGSSSYPTFNRFTITDAGYALFINDNVDAILDDSDIYGNARSAIRVDSGGDLDMYYRLNNVAPGDSLAIFNNSTEYISAQSTWWGTSSPTSALFYDSAHVSWDFYSTTKHTTNNGAYKLLIPDEQMFVDLVKLKGATDLEKNKDWGGAVDIYKDIIATSTIQQTKKRAVKSILRVNEQSDQNYSDLKDILASEINSATDRYKAIYCYLDSEIKLKEGKTSEAIEAFTTYAEQYKGTSMEVEMLTRIANIYGEYLGDKVMAKEYADKAAMLNPGQDVLYVAYSSADIEYDPSQYEDVFNGVEETFEIQKPYGELGEEAAVSVSVSPNPFNPATTLSYNLIEDGHVSLAIYNISGQKVATLVDSAMPAGTHQTVFDGSHLASGMYFYRFESGNVMRNGKMLLVK